MKKVYLFISILFITSLAVAQTVTTIPSFPRADEPVTIRVDVTGTSLDNFAWNNETNPVWVWTWVSEGCASNCDAPTNVNPATSAQDAAKATRISTDPDVYEITFTPTTFFNRPASELKKIGLKLKSRDWADGLQTDNDRIIELFSGYAVTVTQPANFPLFITNGDNFTIAASASESSSLSIKINGVEVATADDATEIEYVHTVTGENGTSEVVVTGSNGEETRSTTFQYIVRTPVVTETRPQGIIDGINYHSDDAARVTLSLWAPGKNSVYVLGDFTDWEIDPAYLMKKDGEHFWIELSGLTPGEEYAFQYLIDEAVYVADPYADKILDPDDQYIPQGIYPDLKAYPDKARKEQWYFNRLAVLQTGQTPFEWKVANFEKPAKEELVIYELLVRDFFASDDRHYQSLIDTIGYFKRLGVNAIELMPITEFNGNDSWGYNPTFMFAPDKAYGTKNKLKEFIDVCHQNGIAVILDMVMNHQDAPNPYAMMDMNFSSFRIEADNKWFNVNPTHPFNVFFDMNHESSYTQKYLDTVNYYWLNEYKFDGFRFDLTKGFTQVNNPDNVDAWSQYDASRIALLKRMADRIWEHSPDAYVILEHLSVNSEEKELAEYRADEGKGMMLWGKMTEEYNRNTMGEATGSDISRVLHTSRGWDVPHLIGYMESHDEERLMVRNINNGKNVSGHNTRQLNIALQRMASAATIFYTLPGPKMLWQFGELGYDYSINYCADGTINNNCRVGAKPVRWDYRDEPNRYALYEHIADLNRLRRTYDVFSYGDATLSTGDDLVKTLVLKNSPYTTSPASGGDMNVVVVVNFDVTQREVEVPFPHSGNWYDYYKGSASLSVTNEGLSVNLKPGQFKLYTDYPIESPFVTNTEEVFSSAVSLYPNPVGDRLYIDAPYPVSEVNLVSVQGVRMPLSHVGEDAWDTHHVPTGIFVVEVKTGGHTYRVRLLKK